MNLNNLLRGSLVSALFAAGGSAVLADVVETKNGSRLVGTVSKIDGGSVSITTDYAGTITVKQSEVTAITTDAPVAVRLASGTRLDGKISSSGGELKIAGADGTLNTTVAKVAASWAAGGKDPAIVALERGWAYEASVDVAGKSGNKSQLATGFAFRATLAGPSDTLQFYTAYDRQVSDGVKSADQFKAGSDYANNFSGNYSWYARDEVGFDRIKDIQLYNVAAVGLGYDLIKEPKHTLTTRAGVSFRYESYKPNAQEVTRLLLPPSILSIDTARRLATKESVNSAGLDFGLEHKLELDNSRLVNRLTFVPTFEDFGVYRLTHESFYELPLLNTQWKLRLGVSNDYNSEPGKNIDKLDTTYFTRLVLSWK